MFGISFSEIMLILVIALIVLGPRQLPIVAGRIGQLIYSTRDYFTHFKQQLYDQTGLVEFEKTKLELINSINKLKYDIAKQDTKDNNLADMFIFEDNIFYQPELEFDREPELFDDLPLHEINNEPK